MKKRLVSVRFLEYNDCSSSVVSDGGSSMEYMTSAEFAEKWNISQRRVAIYCKEGRIEGAVLKGRVWMIPSTAKKPEDPRKLKKNG